jgi:hypothetical protein
MSPMILGKSYPALPHFAAGTRLVKISEEYRERSRERERGLRADARVLTSERSFSRGKGQLGLNHSGGRPDQLSESGCKARESAAKPACSNRSPKSGITLLGPS